VLGRGHQRLTCRGVKGKGTRTVVGVRWARRKKWRGSPRRSGVNGVAGRDQRGGVPTVEGGRMTAGDAPRYPAVL
jgi:hypothetical protein